MSRFAGEHPKYPKSRDLCEVVAGKYIGDVVEASDVRVGPAFTPVYKVMVEHPKYGPLLYWPWNLRILPPEEADRYRATR